MEVDTEPPAKRRRSNTQHPREIGVMRQPTDDNASATFLGSSSGIHFIRIVYNAFARRSAHLSQNNPSPNNTLVPGEDDQLHQSPQYEATKSISNELWTPAELDLRTSKPKPSFENLVYWTRSYFDNWHPMPLHPRITNIHIIVTNTQRHSQRL